MCLGRGVYGYGNLYGCRADGQATNTEQQLTSVVVLEADLQCKLRWQVEVQVCGSGEKAQTCMQRKGGLVRSPAVKSKQNIFRTGHVLMAASHPYWVSTDKLIDNESVQRRTETKSVPSNILQSYSPCIQNSPASSRHA